MNDPIVVVGAGPAGLTAAYELTKRGVRPLVFDGDTQVGGLAKTVVYKNEGPVMDRPLGLLVR